MLAKILAGGQTGVDRAGLDAAIECNIPHGGWCPKGRLAEDGEIHERYPLREPISNLYVELGYDLHSRSDHYRIRTHLNIRDSDGTLILTPWPLDPTGGTKFTIRTTRELTKPCLVLGATERDVVWRTHRWMKAQNIRTLNVAGPRESRQPGLYDQALEAFRQIFRGSG